MTAFVSRNILIIVEFFNLIWFKETISLLTDPIHVLIDWTVFERRVTKENL